MDRNIVDKGQEFIDKIWAGDKKSIIKALDEKVGSAYTLNALLFIVENKYYDEEIIPIIQELTSSKKEAYYKASDFAHAALEVLGIKKYIGNSEDIPEIIKSFAK